MGGSGINSARSCSNLQSKYVQIAPSLHYVALNPETPLSVQLPQERKCRGPLEQAQEVSDGNASIDMASDDELGSGRMAVIGKKDLKKMVTESLGLDVTKFFKNERALDSRMN